MRRPLGLHHHSINEIEPFEFVEIAAACGYDRVSLFTHLPTVPHAGHESMFKFPVVTPQMKPEMLKRLEGNGLRVVGAEFFLMRPDVDLSGYVPGLATGRELGAAHAVTHIFETDKARAIDIVGAFCDLAAAEDLKVCIEFCQLTPGCKSILEAAWYVEHVGRSNLGINICPLHLVRSGGTAADIARLAPYIVNGQINDGFGLHVSSDYFAEVHNRELPGDGDFPLHDFLSALPAETPIEVKAPCDRRRDAGISALDYARDAFARSRALVDGLTSSR